MKPAKPAPRRSHAAQLEEARAQDRAAHAQTAGVLRRMAMLQELARLGMDMARRTEQQVRTAGASGDAKALLEAVVALDRITTEVCRTVALEAEMEKALLAAPSAPAPKAPYARLAARLAAPDRPEAADVSPPQGRGRRLH